MATELRELLNGYLTAYEGAFSGDDLLNAEEVIVIGEDALVATLDERNVPVARVDSPRLVDHPM